MDTVDDLKKKLHEATKENAELITQHKQEKSQYEKEITKLRLELERGKAIHRGLEYELSVARKEARMQMYAAEEQLCVAKSELVELQVLSGKNQQKVAEAEKLFHKAQQKWEEEHQKCAKEKDDIRRVYHHEILFLVKEKSEAERAAQDLNDALQNMRRKLRDVEAERDGCSDRLRHQAFELEFRADRHQQLIRELEAATERTRKLEGDTEAARAAHLECQYNTQIMQLRIQELEEALNSEKGSSAEAFSVSKNMKRDFRKSANAHEREQNVLQREHFSSSKQLQERTEENKETRDLSGKVELTKSSSNVFLEEGEMEVMNILRSFHRLLEENCVLTKQLEVPVDSLAWPELYLLMYENIHNLVLDFRRAQDKISHLERVCKDKTDTVRDLKQSEEDILQNIAEQLKAQEHCWQKEKRHLELEYSGHLAEAHARAQEYQAAAQENRERLYVLEKKQEKLAQENVSVRNSLTTAQSERSSLLAACALLSGALFPLYSRLCAMTSQKNLLQYQVNCYELVNQRIRTIVHTFFAAEENNQDEARQRQRRAKNLVYVFRKAVIVVLAVNRFRAVAQCSTSLFTWRNSLEGGNGIQVCVGESAGRSYEDGADRVEALDWLTNTTLRSSIISSLSELQDVLSKPDPKSWLSGNSLLNATRNSFSKLMDKLSLMLGTVPLNYPSCITYLEKDSLIQRLACGLLRINTQALETGLHDRLPSMKNVASLQQLVFEYRQRLHVAEAECRLLGLQLADFKWSFNEMKKDSEKAVSLQKQLNTLQLSMITLDNMQEELNNTLQHEHEARILLLEQEQQINELNSRLQMCSSETADKGQDLNQSIRSLPETAMDMRRDQKKLLIEMEQERRQLQERVQDAEIDRLLIITHMKAVETTLQLVREEALILSADAASTEFCLKLPSLHIETLSYTEPRSRPEAIAFQDVVQSFVDLYQLATSRIETLLREFPQLRTAAQRPTEQTFTLRESSENRKESKYPSSFRLDSQADQSYVPEFRLLPAEADTSSRMTLPRASTQSPKYASSSVIPDRPRSGSSMSAGGIPDRTRTQSPIYTSSSGTLDRPGTEPSIHVPPGAIPDRPGTEPSIHVSPGAIPDRPHTEPSIHVSPGAIPDRPGTEPSIHVSAGAIPDRPGTEPSIHVSPGAISDRPGTEPSIHVSPGAIPGRSSTQPPTLMSSSGRPDRSSTQPPVHLSSIGRPDRPSTGSSIHVFSSEIMDRPGSGFTIRVFPGEITDRSRSLPLIHMFPRAKPARAYSVPSIPMSCDVIQERAGTGSSLDISSGVKLSRTYIMCGRNTSFNAIPHTNRISTGSSDISTGVLMDRISFGPSADEFIFVRSHEFGGWSSRDRHYSWAPNRSGSLPSLRFFSQDF